MFVNENNADKEVPGCDACDSAESRSSFSEFHDFMLQPCLQGHFFHESVSASAASKNANPLENIRSTARLLLICTNWRQTQTHLVSIELNICSAIQGVRKLKQTAQQTEIVSAVLSH